MLRSLRYVADMQSNRTPCGNRLHPSCGEVEGANASSWHLADLPNQLADFRCRGMNGLSPDATDGSLLTQLKHGA